MEIINAKQYEHTVPIGAPLIPKLGFLISARLMKNFPTPPIAIEKTGAFTYPRDSKIELTIIKKEENIMAGAIKTSNGAPISIFEFLNNNERISREKTDTPTTIGAEIAPIAPIAFFSAFSIIVAFPPILALVRVGKKATETGEIIARDKLNIETANVV